MLPVASAQQARALDQHAIESWGLPSIALMETASHAIAAMAKRLWTGGEVVVVCGPGNNGGDGYGCARWLRQWQIPVRIWAVMPPATADARTMASVCARMEIPHVNSLGPATLIVDALFGTGLTRPIEGVAAQAIEAICEHPGAVLSADLPSGLHADTGERMGAAVRAGTTLTLACLKPAFFLRDGPDLSGDVTVADLGLGRPADPIAQVAERSHMASLWPRRRAHHHKGDSGHLMIVAGSTAMAGASLLCAQAALAAGVGLITVLAPRGALPRLEALAPEAMVMVCGDGDVMSPPHDRGLHRKTAILMGPGLGGGAPLPSDLETWLHHLWHTSTLPICADADALVCASGPGSGPRVLTPHPGEAARMLDRPVSAVQRDRFGAARLLSDGRHTAVLKGPHTLVATPDRPMHINTTGNAVLATGGSGDVLAGVIGALLARGVSAHDAARLAAHVHGLTADQLAQERSVGWTAMDLAKNLPHALETMLGSAP
ncbi:MAG: NAD(P)H-hydrate dehydratase [Myxococcota bacterium]